MSALNIDTLSAAERTALAAERLGPRYGRLSHNPYRTYSEDELEDTNGTPEQVQEQPPGDDDPRKVRNGFSRPGTSRREPLATVGQPEGE